MAAIAGQLELLHSVVRACRSCNLCITRNFAVPGEGATGSSVMFIGEAPGANEDKQARPFVGTAGRLLEELLALAGMQRSDTYITNIVKCRPPNNRDPEEAEIAKCKVWLQAELQLVQPTLIVPLGGYAASWFIPGQRITQIRGRLHWTELFGQQRPLYPTLHPAAALRRVDWRFAVEEDFKRLPEVLESVRRGYAEAEGVGEPRLRTLEGS